MPIKKVAASKAAKKKASKHSTSKKATLVRATQTEQSKKPAKTTKPQSSLSKSVTALTTRKTSLAKRAPRVTLITGGTGFLGAHLVQQLVEEKHKSENHEGEVLRVMAQRIPSWLEKLANEKEVRVEAFAGSVTNAEDVRRAVEDVEAIYHLAGLVSRDTDDAHKMYELHVEGTRVLCDAANLAGVRAMVLASTSGTIAVTEDGAIVPDENFTPPLSIITRWAYYASKFYQERAALEAFKGERLVIVNPALLLGSGDERLSSTKLILDFLSRKIPTVPKGGVSFVDARDAATALIAAMNQGRHGERYLLGAVNWTFAEFFSRLGNLTKVAAPRIALPSRVTTFGAGALDALFRHWNAASPVDARGIEMAEHFWYCDSTKAARELGFDPRDPMETLNDTVKYIRQNFLGNSAFV